MKSVLGSLVGKGFAVALAAALQHTGQEQDSTSVVLIEVSDAEQESPHHIQPSGRCHDNRVEQTRNLEGSGGG